MNYIYKISFLALKLVKPFRTALSVIWSYLSFRLSDFKAALRGAFTSAHAQTLPLATVKDSVKTFSEEEIESALQVMQDANQIMVANDDVFLI